ncbi:MAG: hypothetical protein RLZZ283_474 [Candidatus Parcubacteria bacterium]|jgi:heme A synthase
MWTLKTLIEFVTFLIGFTIPIAVGICLVIFFWGLAILILDSGNAEKMKEGRNKMLWGILSMFVVLSLGGIVAILQSTLEGNF